MAHQQHSNAFNDAMELLIENGFDEMAGRCPDRSWRFVGYSVHS
jgi:hypothetical protein